MPRKYVNELVDSIDAPISYTSRLLYQFANSGVSPYTIHFSRIAHTNYNTSISGERVFNSCLTNLPVHYAADENLQFAWSETCIWRNLEVHRYEYENLLLAAAVAECLPQAYAGMVLSCLANKYDTVEHSKPPLSEWRALARSLDGMLVTSDFGLMVDDRMRLDPYRVISGHSTSCTTLLTPPTAFASALQAVGDLSITGTGQLTLVGGSILGWFAAFAELFLGIGVQISSRDGETLYSAQSDSKALLRCVFVDVPEHLTPTVPSQDSRSLVLTVMSASNAEINTVPRVPFTGRVSWEALLPKTFEGIFHRIAHQDSKYLVQSIGGVACLFKRLAEDSSTPETVISRENRLNTGALGMGLIQTLCNWFPELRHLQGRLERIQGLSWREAADECGLGAKGFSEICGCTLCWVPAYSDLKPDPGKLPDSFCLLAVMETILNLGLAMSRITVVPKLYPSRAGILSIYQRQVQKLLDAKQEWHRVYDIEFDRVTRLFGKDWNANYSQRLQSVAAIFSGSWPTENLPDNLIALSHEGICVNVLAAQHGDKRSTTRKDADVIRVQAGHIAWKQKIYSRACLGPPQGITLPDYTWEPAHCEHFSKELYCK